ncbi:MAG: NADH-quinone oxidoreductase subunit J [Bacteroidetes bacterium]|nr:NADH-quinone oxidoreductase subunit J [Bacteroidota bacterium]
MLEYVFYILSAISIACALLMVFAKNPIHSVLFLIGTFFSIAGHFVILNAHFLAIVQIIVYTGAIMVLFLYVIMLLNLNKESESTKPNIVKVAAVVSAGLLFLVMLASFKESIAIPLPEGTDGIGSVKNLGKVLFSEYLLPFEASSVLFLSAMAGSVLLAKKK